MIDWCFLFAQSLPPALLVPRRSALARCESPGVSLSWAVRGCEDGEGDRAVAVAQRELSCPALRRGMSGATGTDRQVPGRTLWQGRGAQYPVVPPTLGGGTTRRRLDGDHDVCVAGRTRDAVEFVANEPTRA